MHSLVARVAHWSSTLALLAKLEAPALNVEPSTLMCLRKRPSLLSYFSFVTEDFVASQNSVKGSVCSEYADSVDKKSCLRTHIVAGPAGLAPVWVQCRIRLKKILAVPSPHRSDSMAKASLVRAAISSVGFASGTSLQSVSVCD